MCVSLYLSTCYSGFGQRKIGGSQFSPLTTGVPGMELRSSGWAANTFTWGATWLARDILNLCGVAGSNHSIMWGIYIITSVVLHCVITVCQARLPLSGKLSSLEHGHRVRRASCHSEVTGVLLESPGSWSLSTWGCGDDTTGYHWVNWTTAVVQWALTRNQAWWYTPLVPALREAQLYKFKASLVCSVSSRTARAI